MLEAQDLPYQEVGAQHLCRYDRRGLFDDPGLGKSYQAIRALDKMALKRGLVICPAAVRETWLGEFRKWAQLPRKIIKGKDIQDLNLWLRGKVDVLLLSYEMATSWANRLDHDIMPFMVIDEAHYLKTRDSGRTLAILGKNCDGTYGLAKWACHVFYLTGTPSPNDAADVWPLCRHAGATTLSFKIFTDRYFTKREGTYSNSYIPRPEMVEEFKRMMSSFSLRRTKKDVNLELPPIWCTTSTVDGDTAEIKELLRNYPGLEKAIVEAVERGGLSFLDAQHIATLRRLVGEAKAPAYANLLVEEINNGLKQIVVFGIHRRALDHIERELKVHGIGVVRVDGATSDAARKTALSSFKAHGVQVFLGNIRAAGTGVDGLQVCGTVDLFETDWSPAANAQALQRVHRIGSQAEAVHARFITLANSIDEHVSNRVAWKTQNMLKLGTFSPVGA